MAWIIVTAQKTRFLRVPWSCGHAATTVHIVCLMVISHTNWQLVKKKVRSRACQIQSRGAEESIRFHVSPGQEPRFTRPRVPPEVLASISHRPYLLAAPPLILRKERTIFTR